MRPRARYTENHTAMTTAIRKNVPAPAKAARTRKAAANPKASRQAKAVREFVIEFIPHDHEADLATAKRAFAKRPTPQAAKALADAQRRVVPPVAPRPRPVPAPLASPPARVPVAAAKPVLRDWPVTKTPRGMFLVQRDAYTARDAVKRCGHTAVGTVRAVDYHEANRKAMALEERAYPTVAKRIKAMRLL